MCERNHRELDYSPALLVDGPELRHVVVLEAHGQRDAELADLHLETLLVL